MINIPVSVGELVDKVTILRIKKGFASGEKLENVNKELSLLENKLRETVIPEGAMSALHDINKELWGVEDLLRKHELEGMFDEGFVSLARNVYMLNDDRARVKRQINEACSSEIVEEKIYRS